MLEKEKRVVLLDDELWYNLLILVPRIAGGLETSIRLLSGKVLERMLISNRGEVLGREAEGLAGYHGTIDNSMLTFGTDDIEAVQVPTFLFWQRPKWVALNPQHPARHAWQKKNEAVS